ncbi:AAA family ATPase [Myxococcota bacterium]|nr:AAA family ATPase [Myxococcota bacterium]MBU1429262.1 AAA family ATPase [Myxococcota bacterium]MBU1897361.1 AAA family ATPase [Myxococcota bacterium]
MRVEHSLELIRDNLNARASSPRKLLHWSITEGFTGDEEFTDLRDPIKALDFIIRYEDSALFALRDFHPYLKDPVVVRRLRDCHRAFKDSEHRKNVLLLSGKLSVPAELEKETAVIDFDLPQRSELGALIREFSTAYQLTHDEEALDRFTEAALGLTYDEASFVLSKSLIRHRDFDIDTLLSEKKAIIRKSGLLEFYETNEKFGEVGGLRVLKEWLIKRKGAFTQQARDFGLPVPKGILLIGIPGCGKSLTAKAVGALWQMPLLRLDVGKVFSGLVGSSEQNIRKVIATAEAVAPAILWLDELEKGFSGVQSSGQSDAGTTARVFGSFITWLQEKSSAVFVIATANDVSMLPPELLRKGRFDEIFFVDLPSEEERRDIYEIHLKKKQRPMERFDIDALARAAKGFSGAEIEQAVVAALYDAFFDGDDIDTPRILNASDEVIPLSRTMKEKIDDLRDWAAARARSASGLPIGPREEEVEGEAEGPSAERRSVPAGFRDLEL